MAVRPVTCLLEFEVFSCKFGVVDLQDDPGIVLTGDADLK